MAADSEAGWALPSVPPVVQRRSWYLEEIGYLLRAHQRIVGVCGFVHGTEPHRTVTLQNAKTVRKGDILLCERLGVIVVGWVKVDGPEGTDLWGLDHRVNWSDQSRLGIEMIKHVSGPTISDGRVLPAKFYVVAYDYKTGIEATLVYDSVGSRRVLVGIQNMTSARGRVLKVKDLKAFPTTRVGREFGRLLEDLKTGLGADGALGPVADAQEPKPHGRNPVTDETLLVIAWLYNDQHGAPAAYFLMGLALQKGKWLGEKEYDQEYLRQLVGKARKREFLEPTTWGKKNWNLTPKAEALLDALEIRDKLEGARDGDSH
ncbi:MAG: hypothetical protein ACI8TP_004727 [Acidimicrobiales bacterium]